MRPSGDTLKLQSYTQSERVENEYPSKYHPQKSRCGQLICDKRDFKITKLIRDKDGHFIIIKRTLHQEDLTLLNT